MQVSTSTRTAPMNSALRPISRSRPNAARRTPAQFMAASAASAICWVTRCLSPASGQRPGVFFEQRPGLVAHLLLAVGIEPGLLQRLLEGFGVRLVEDETGLGHLVGLGLVHFLPIGALGER